MPGDCVIEARQLTREFGSLVAVDHLELCVGRQQFFGFLGPNGAGKSTTIKMMTGLLPPTSGEARILGFDVASEPLEVKRRIGVVPEGLALFDRLTGWQMLNFTGRMYGLRRETAASRSEELLQFMGLLEARDQIVADYSHGMKKKLALAAALIHRPEVLFLDEPFEGVDPVASASLKQMLQRYVVRGGTIFLTSHILEIVERLCTHAGVIHQGRLVACGSVEELRGGAAGEAGRATLEEVFVRLVGRASDDPAQLDWL